MPDLKQNVTTIYIPSLGVQVHYMFKYKIKETLGHDLILKSVVDPHVMARNEDGCHILLVVVRLVGAT